MTKTMGKIAVVGAGLMGRLVAWQLAKLNLSVTLFDQDSPQGINSAAYTAAGLLTPCGESLSCETNIVEMGEASLLLWPRLINQLTQSVGFQHRGSICVSHAQDQGDYQRFCQYIARQYPMAQLQALDKKALSTIEPSLAEKFGQGAFLPNEGVINNHQLLAALAHELEKLKVNWLTHTKVVALSANNVTFNIKCATETENFDLVVDCRGIGASNVFANAGDNSALKDLRSVRGEVIYLKAPAVNISRPVRLMHPRYKLYIAPKGNDNYAIGATEIESCDLGAMTVQSSLELLSAIYSLHPGFAEAQIIHQLSYGRPAFNDNQPKILNRAGLIQINGLYRHGYLLAPVVLQAALDCILSQLGLEQTSNTASSYAKSLVTEQAQH